MGELYATRHISVGEEITIQYTPLCAPRTVRRMHLAETRFFNCRCSTCTLPVERSRSSDERRLRIRDLLHTIEDARFPPRVSVEELTEAVRWARMEGTRLEEARLLLCGSQVLTLYDELGIAMSWAKEARRVFQILEGENSDSLQRLDDADRVHAKMAAAPRTLRI